MLKYPITKLQLAQIKRVACEITGARWPNYQGGRNKALSAETGFLVMLWLKENGWRDCQIYNTLGCDHNTTAYGLKRMVEWCELYPQQKDRMDKLRLELKGML